MTCPSEERLALHACADAFDPAIEAHLAGCGACRALAAAFQSDADLLRVEPAVPDTVAAAVSRAVLDRTRPNRGRWVWTAVAAIAAALIIALWLRPAADRQPPPETIAKVAPAVAPPITAPKPSTPPVVAARRARPAARAKAATARSSETVDAGITVEQQSDGTLVLAKRTADPNVIILLVAEDESKPGDIDEK